MRLYLNRFFREGLAVFITFSVVVGNRRLLGRQNGQGHRGRQGEGQ